MKIIEAHKTPGALAVIGIPFFAGGLFFFYAMLNPNAQWSGTKPSLFVGLIVSFIFTLIGAAFLFGRSGYILDPFRRRGLTYWGLLVPFKRFHFKFENIKYIHICKEIRKSKNSSYTVYPVRLITTNDVKINIENNLRDYLLAREKAESIARQCSFNLRNDEEGGKILGPSEVDPAFMEKLESNISRPQSPLKTHIKCSGSTGKSVIESNFKTSIIGALTPSLIVLLFVTPFALYFFRELSTGNPPNFIRYSFIGFFFVIPILLTLNATLGRRQNGFKLSFSDKSIEVQSYKIMGHTTHKIKLQEIDDITLRSFDAKNALLNLINTSVGASGGEVSIISNDTRYSLYPFENAENAQFLYDLIYYELSRYK
ncbi:hypothetical protein M899_0967 [Bacteriovorax sp. BSW11_IV]|uniref:hypothetical protein n=1 Tax=Bacteriovorax sp. BSW11_IV TaxID=1353529 RepID=UPI00038A1DA1|nr:hypothetical protein [Bacteriovorax sp. BSW11_IV]EQC48643.1 hypothetical protein M899_0967 [Bacteriovorax sp. BSW11_IV]